MYLDVKQDGNRMDCIIIKDTNEIPMPVKKMITILTGTAPSVFSAQILMETVYPSLRNIPYAIVMKKNTTQII